MVMYDKMKQSRKTVCRATDGMYSDGPYPHVLRSMTKYFFKLWSTEYGLHISE